MIECKTEEEISVFDGRVIQRFRPYGSSEHYHLDLMASVEITTDRKGRQYLRFNLTAIPNGKTNLTNPRLTPETLPQAQAFVDEVMRAISSRQE